MRPETAILLVSCADRKGLVTAVTQFVRDHNGNILDLDQHVDAQEDIFVMRLEWDLAGFDLAPDQLAERLEVLATPYQMTWQLFYSSQPTRMVIFVSKSSHCLYDLLARTEAGELNAEVPLIVSNHPDLQPVAERFGIPFKVFPITKENKRAQEDAELQLLEQHKTDLVVMARYMQILTGEFIARFPHRIINIHHSFLPAFAGARPYHSAFSRGVKLIGATAHYATEDLDEGPIIAQDVIRVSHRDQVSDLVRKGKDVEKIVLAQAVYQHLQHKVWVYNNKTVVFD